MEASVLSGSPTFWSPLDMASSAAATPSVHVVEKPSQSSVVSRNHNVRYARYNAVQEALRSVTKLDEDDGFYLSPEVSARASKILSVICANSSVDAPKFLPQDGEVAIFTWETAVAKRFLSIYSEDSGLLDVHKETFVKCSHELSAHADELTFWIRELGAAINSSNDSTDNYA